MSNQGENEITAQWQFWAGDFQQPINIDFVDGAEELLARGDVATWGVLITLVDQVLAPEE